MTTIKLKNGSGAPLAGDLVQGEPALDLTNKRLYTEDSGGSVIEVGTNPTSLTTGTFTSTGIDDNATSTAITIDANENVGVGVTSQTTKLSVQSTGNGYTNGAIEIKPVSGQASYITNAGGNTYISHDGASDSFVVNASGNVGIGTSGPIGKLDVSDGTNPLVLDNAGTYNELQSYNVPLVLNRQGNNVGIGTDSPSELLEISGTEGALRLNQEGGAYANLRSSDFGTLYIDADAGNTAANSSMRFSVDAAERMRIDSSGNLLVGKDSNTISASGAKLGTSGSNFTRSSAEVVYFNRTTNDGGIATFAKDGSTVGSIGSVSGDMFIGTGDTGFRFHDSNNVIYPANQGAVSDATLDLGDSSYRYRQLHLSSNALIGGNVGIGTASPTSKMVVEVGNNGPAASGTMNTGVVLQADGASHALNMGSSATAGYSWINAAFANNSSIPSTLALMTGAQERMRIDSSGRLLVGKSAYNWMVDGIQTEGVSQGRLGITNSYTDSNLFLRKNNATGHVVAMWYNNSVVGSIAITSSSTSYNTSSDYRLKENVVDLDNGINRLKQIPVHRFNFIAAPDTTVDGFIAHEVQDVVPEAITGAKDAVDDEGNPEYQGIDQSKLVPLLTAALQEAVTRIETLEAEVAALKGA